jgi:hypothetical protein
MIEAIIQCCFGSRSLNISCSRFAIVTRVPSQFYPKPQQMQASTDRRELNRISADIILLRLHEWFKKNRLVDNSDTMRFRRSTLDAQIVTVWSCN